MNKIPIKITKRKDAETAAAAKIKSLLPGESSTATTFGKATIARRLRRETAEVISEWVSERRRNDLAEEIAARRFYCSEFITNW